MLLLKLDDWGLECILYCSYGTAVDHPFDQVRTH